MRPTDAGVLESQAIDDPSGRIAWRILEDTPGVECAAGLMPAPPTDDAAHGLLHGVSFPGFCGEGGEGDNLIGLEVGAAVRHFQVVWLSFTHRRASQLDRARRENVRLRKELIELRKLEEKFVNADEVKVAQFNRDRMIRDRLLNIRDRLAAPMSAESDIKKCWDMLDIEIRQVLTALADAGVDSVSSEVEPETAMV